MTISELIKELQKYPSDRPVVLMITSDPNLYDYSSPIERVVDRGDDTSDVVDVVLVGEP